MATAFKSTRKNMREPRKPNDGLTESTAYRLCVYCLAGQCTNVENDMLHLVGPDSEMELKDDFFEFVMKNRSKQPDTTKPMNHLRDASVETKSESSKTSNVPCQYCVIGKCTNWKTDTRFKHILGWYCPLNSEQIGLLGELRNNKIIRSNKQKEDETKRRLEAVASQQQRLEDLIKSAIAERPDVAELILKAAKGKEEEEETPTFPQQETGRKGLIRRIPIAEILKYKDAQLSPDELK